MREYKEEIFVLEDKFFDRLLKYTDKEFHIRHPETSFCHHRFVWRGKKIFKNRMLIDYCFSRANEEIQSTEEYRNKLTDKIIELAKQYKWVKDKKKYSRCGKWIKSIIK